MSAAHHEASRSRRGPCAAHISQNTGLKHTKDRRPRPAKGLRLLSPARHPVPNESRGSRHPWGENAASHQQAHGEYVHEALVELHRSGVSPLSFLDDNRLASVSGFNLAYPRMWTWMTPPSSFSYCARAWHLHCAPTPQDTPGGGGGNFMPHIQPILFEVGGATSSGPPDGSRLETCRAFR